MSVTAKKQTKVPLINGIDTQELSQVIEEVRQDPAKGLTRWGVTTSWDGGTRTNTRVRSFEIGGKKVDKNFTIYTDEPFELGGTNLYANPQETLMAAFNSCMMVGYVALASLEGITLDEVRIETKGDLDLRGFLNLDPKVKAGYDEIEYKVTIRGNGTPEQFQKIHEGVMATSPNRFNIANPVRLKAQLVVEE